MPAKSRTWTKRLVCQRNYVISPFRAEPGCLRLPAMIKRLIPILCALALPLFAGCGQVVVFGHVVREGSSSSAVTTPADGESRNKASVSNAHAAGTSAAPAPAGPAPSARVINAVNLSLSPSAETEVAGDSTFVTATLLTAIKDELTARGLLDERDSSASAGTAEILIDHVSKQPTVNAVVFGHQLMAGTLSGAIRVRDTNGAELPEHKVVAESRLSIAADGSDKNPLAPLYKRFAVLAADRLAGVQSKPVAISADGQPRS